MKILGIIPARAGSSRLPGKNKKRLAGRELIRYAIDAALGSEYVTHWVLSTDDEDIREIGQEYSQLIVLKRPSAIAGDQAKAITYVEHALSQLREVNFEMVVIVQPTSPFTWSMDIDGTVNLLKVNKAASAASVMQIDQTIHPLKLKKMEGHLLLPFWEAENGRMAAHEIPQLFSRNGSVYASLISTINDGLIVADPCLGYLMPRERSVDINDPIDFVFAEFLLSQQPNILNQ
ncbi:MAG: acylneuraminate cytidylyltransferase family protein [Bacteroidota bacterium]